MQHQKYAYIFAKFQDLKYNNSERWNDFKLQKQAKINSMDFSQMKGLVGKLGNKEVRSWYKFNDEYIQNLLDNTKPLEQQARQAHELRNTYRIQSRNLMKDQKAREVLDVKKPNITFEEALKHKEVKYGLIGDDAYQDIIRSSQTTNKEYDIISGIGDAQHESHL